jgi:hypothetical protein
MLCFQKSKIRFFCFLFFIVAVCNAHSEYNPPVLGEDLFFLAYPSLVSSARSSAGGSIFTANPASVNINPALVAGMQRTSLDVAYMNLSHSRDNVSALHAALLGATRWGVWSAAVQGIFANYDLSIGNSFAVRGGFARDVTEKLYVGASLFGAFDFSDDTAVPAFALDLGFVYNMGDLGFLKQSRVAFVMQNLGLTFDADKLGLPGIVKITNAGSLFPSPVTPKVGFAAQFVDMADFDAGFSADLAFAGLVSGGFNLLFDAGVQVRYKMLTLNVAFNVNLTEEIEGVHSLIPAIGLSWKQSISTGGIDFLSSKGWQQTDLSIEAVYQPLFDGSHLAGGGITANLGARDVTPPEITLWPEDGESK